jgi:hypothetical protein
VCKALIEQDKLKQGINFALAITEDKSITAFFKDITGSNFLQSLTPQGLIYAKAVTPASSETVLPRLMLNWQVNTSNSFGIASFTLKDIALIFPLIGNNNDGFSSLPVIKAEGGAKIKDLGADIEAEVNLYEGTLTLALTAMPSLADLLSKAGLVQSLPTDNVFFKPLLGIQLSRLEAVIDYANKKLHKIGFQLKLGKWELIKDIFTLETVQFDFAVFNPGDTNDIEASFLAVARIGKTVQLIAKGSYPSGDLSIGLDPATPIFINDIVTAFIASETSFGGNTAITELYGAYNIYTKVIDLGLTVAKVPRWNVAEETGFTLDNVNLGIYGSEKYVFTLVAAFTYTFTKVNKAPLIFNGSAVYDAGWVFDASYKGDVTLKDIGTEFGFENIPSQLDAFHFLELAFTIDTINKTKAFHGAFALDLFGQKNVLLDLQVNKSETAVEFHGKFKADFADKQLDFTADFIKNEAGYDLKLKLLFTIASVTIYLDAEIDNTKKLQDGTGGETAPATTENVAEMLFSGGTKGLNLHITSLLQDLLKDLLPGYGSEVPLDFLPDIVLEDVFVSYDGKAKQLNFIALTTINEKEIKLFFHYQQKTGDAESSFAFGLEADFDSLKDLPLVGGQLKDVRLTGMGFVYTSFTPGADGSEQKAFTLPELSAAGEGGIRKIIVPEKGRAFNKGFNLTGQLEYSQKEKPFSLDLPMPVTKSEATAPPAAADTGGSNLPAQATPQTVATVDKGIKWLNLDKKIGPLQVSKIGFAYANKKISLLFTGNVDLSAIVFSVDGLGIAFNPSKLIKGEFAAGPGLGIDAEFKLSGLGLSITKGPLKITGMFVMVTPKENEVFSFYGAAQISTAKFTITGMGAFAKIKDSGAVSFFVYAAYIGPIGGPVFFFVNGIAIGFGYNRRVRPPKIQDVHDFPLVAMVLSGEDRPMAKILDDLITQDIIPVSPGDYWLAIGIKFTAFRIVDAFVLLIVQFGNKLSFMILGLAILRFPQQGDFKLAYVELALMIRFGEGSDVISVDAILTPNSFVISPDCRLTGGFAFYTWVSGEHEGDFVITLGGYHTRFRVPAHYPRVDRLGLNWKIGKFLSIKGEMYFALCSTAIMAGGRWEVVFDIGFFKASLVVWADIIISWSPFYYDLSAGVRIRIELHLKIFNIKIELGAEMHFWGPPFGGEVKVSLVIFSITINFGAPQNGPDPLDWNEFTKTFIPDKKETAAPNHARGAMLAQTPQKNPIDTRIAAGIVQEYKYGTPGNEKVATIVNPYDLLLAAESFVPTTTLQVKTAAGAEKEIDADTLMDKADSIVPGRYHERSNSLGIKPMSIALSSTMTVWVSKKEADAPDTIHEMNVVCTAKGVPEAMWGTDVFKYDGSVPDAKIITTVLTGVQLHPTVPASHNKFTIKQIGDFGFTDLAAAAGLPPLVNSNALVQFDNNGKLFEHRTDAPQKEAKKSILDELGSLAFDILKEEAIAGTVLPAYDDNVYRAAIDSYIPFEKNSLHDK